MRVAYWFVHGVSVTWKDRTRYLSSATAFWWKTYKYIENGGGYGLYLSFQHFRAEIYFPLKVFHDEIGANRLTLKIVEACVLSPEKTAPVTWAQLQHFGGKHINILKTGEGMDLYRFNISEPRSISPWKLFTTKLAPIV